MTKKVFIRTMGCQMNVRDSELIQGILQKNGYKVCENDQNAEIIIFNTCSVRKQAEDRVWSLIGSYKGSKIIGLVGCMAQNYKDKAFLRNESINFVVGPQDIHKLPEILAKIKPNGLLERKIWEVDNLIRPEEIYHTGFYQDPNHAYVVISEGCSNFCSYCVVPYVRGPLRHRQKEKILNEIEAAISQGITSFTLLGQNVNSYLDHGFNFIELLEEVNALKGLKKLGFFTSHPKDAGVATFKAIRDLEKLDKTLHLPLQSGSDRVLKLMNRGYNSKEYVALIENYRKIVKDGSLTTDIIVGFPAETDKEFKETCDLIKRIEFNSAYIFKYSPRPQTEAAKMVDNVERQEKEKRHRYVLDLQRKISNKLKGKINEKI